MSAADPAATPTPTPGPEKTAEAEPRPPVLAIRHASPARTSLRQRDASGGADRGRIPKRAEPYAARDSELGSAGGRDDRRAAWPSG